MVIISGILRDKTIANKLMYIPNDDKQNYPFCTLELMVKMFGYATEWTNQSKHTTNVPKIFELTNKI